MCGIVWQSCKALWQDEAAYELTGIRIHIRTHTHTHTRIMPSETCASITKCYAPPPPQKTGVLHQLRPLDPDCRGRGMRVYPCIRAAQKVFVLSNYLFARSCLNCCISGLVG